MIHGGSRQQSSWLHKLKLQQKQQNKWSMQKIVTEHYERLDVSQHAKKVLSNSLRLVDFAIRLVNSVFN